jgi:dinuclear metal center YbgI/SA1388 family protein
MAHISKIIEYFDTILPKTLSEPWDNDGVMILPDSNMQVDHVLIALDVTGAVIEKAKSLSAQLIVTHHPLIFKALPVLDIHDPNGKRVIECIKNNIAVLSYHTRLDEVDGGVCDCLAQDAALVNIQKMSPCGRIGELDKETDFDTFAEQIRKTLKIDNIYGVKCTETVKKVAVVSGSGKDFICDAKKAGADTYLTGEINHSGLIEAKEIGLT